MLLVPNNFGKLFYLLKNILGSGCHLLKSYQVINCIQFFSSCAEVRENTIASLKKAASFGADFVEFDVQLSKDLVPVIYHDFHVCISMKRKNDTNEMEMLELPVKELTLEQLHLLKVILCHE